MKISVRVHVTNLPFMMYLRYMHTHVAMYDVSFIDVCMNMALHMYAHLCCTSVYVHNMKSENYTIIHIITASLMRRRLVVYTVYMWSVVWVCCMYMHATSSH